METTTTTKYHVSSQGYCDTVHDTPEEARSAIIKMVTRQKGDNYDSYWHDIGANAVVNQVITTTETITLK